MHDGGVSERREVICISRERLRGRSGLAGLACVFDLESIESNRMLIDYGTALRRLGVMQGNERAPTCLQTGDTLQAWDEEEER